MSTFEGLVNQGRVIVAYALRHSIALPDGTAATLSDADAPALASNAATRTSFMTAFAAATRAIGMSAASIDAVEASNGRLRPLAEEAITLLDFAAANARKVDDETRKALITSAAAVASGSMTVTQEQEFLKAYEALTVAMAPITVETLDASTMKFPTPRYLLKPPPGAKPPVWTVGRYINVGIFILVLMGTGVSLAYYSVGASSLANYRELQKRKVELDRKRLDAAYDLTPKRAAKEQIEARQGNKTPGATPPTQAEITAANDAFTNSTKEMDAIVEQRDAVKDELESIPRRLNRWAMQPCQESANVLFKVALCAGVNMPPGTAEQQQPTAAVARAASSAVGMSPGDDKEAPATSTRGTVVDVEAARTVIERMGSVYLPLLLGFLGAHAFILRRMSQQISDRTFAKGSGFNHIVRIGLGALAGLASTWLLTPETVGGSAFKAVPTWALAFVAGYGIELVFAFMDRIISAFTAPAK